MATLGKGNLAVGTDEIGFLRNNIEGYATLESVMYAGAPFLVDPDPTNQLTLTGFPPRLYVAPAVVADSVDDNPPRAGNTWVASDNMAIAQPGNIDEKAEVEPYINSLILSSASIQTTINSIVAGLDSIDDNPARIGDGVIAGDQIAVAQPGNADEKVVLDPYLANLISSPASLVGSFLSIVDNGDGTYGWSIGATTGTIDTRAPSNPFDGSVDFFLSMRGGVPVDNVDIALRALSDAVGALTASASVFLNNPVLYIRPTGNDSNDGSSPANAFLTMNGCLAYLANAYVIGGVTIDIQGVTVPCPVYFTQSTAKGALNITVRGDPANVQSAVFEWGSGPAPAHGIIVGYGPTVTLSNITLRHIGTLSGGGVIAAAKGRVNLADTIRMDGSVTTANVLFQANGVGAEIETPPAPAGTTTPFTFIEIDVSGVAGSMFFSYAGGAVTLRSTEIRLLSDFNCSAAFRATYGGSIMWSVSPPAGTAPVTFVGPANIVPVSYVYVNNGTGSRISSLRCPIGYGTEDQFYRTTGAAATSFYNGIGTYTDYVNPPPPHVGGMRHGQTGVYHP